MDEKIGQIGGHGLGYPTLANLLECLARMHCQRRRVACFVFCCVLMFATSLIDCSNKVAAQSAPGVITFSDDASPPANDSPEALKLRIETLESVVADLNQDRSLAAMDAGRDRELPSHFATYDKGWTIRPRDPAETPFELKVELHNQFRYTFFESDDVPSFDAAGNRRIIADRNDFNINRGRLVFSGYAFDKNLGYYANIDYSTVASNSIQPLLSWVSWQQNENLKWHVGLGKVPGTWEWQQTSRFTQGADRTMATTFFRPSISAGVWASGKVTPKLHYTAFVGDGFNTLSLRSNQLDTNFVYSMINWWEPLAKFGPGFSDLENHTELALRVGHAVTQTRNESAPDQTPGAEETVIRLTDGTRLVSPGALSPGESVNAFDIWLYTVHGGMKYRGFSLSGEYYFRWLSNLEGTLGSSFETIYDQGWFVQSGMFVVPERSEVFVRGSQVDGRFGGGSELSVGVNVFPWGQRNTRATFEWAKVDDSPAEQSRTGFVAGASGSLVRVQLWSFF